MTATPSSRQVARRLVPLAFSMSIAKGEYSIWTASTWAILQARRTVVELTSERPMYLILPSLVVVSQDLSCYFRASTHAFNSAMARIVSSIGTSRFARCM